MHPVSHEEAGRRKGAEAEYEWTLERANKDAQGEQHWESHSQAKGEDLNDIHKRPWPCLRKQYRKVLARERKLKVEMSDRVGRRQAAKSSGISPEGAAIMKAYHMISMLE